MGAAMEHRMAVLDLTWNRHSFFLKVSSCFERKGRSMDDILILAGTG